MIRVQAEDFDLAEEIARLHEGRTDIGAVVSFSGLVRAGGGAEPIEAMEIEHYPGMTERALAEIAGQAAARWPLQGHVIVHRIGRLEPGAQIVLVATASRHRAAAFEAAAFLMDYLKSRAPFWKREITAGGGAWVDARESDDAALARWEREEP